MIVSLFLSLSRRIRAWTASVLRKKKKSPAYEHAHVGDAHKERR